MKEYRELNELKKTPIKEIDYEGRREKLFMYAVIVLIIAVLPLIYHLITMDPDPISVNPSTMAAYASRMFYHI